MHILLSIFLTFNFFGDLVSRSILEDKVQMLLPSNFELMSDEMLITKYPSGNRPTIVYSNKDGTVNLAVNHTNNSLIIDQLPEVLPIFIDQFERSYPSIEWRQKGVQKVNKQKFIVLEFITPAIDTKIYNLMFVTELEGRLLMFSFNCPQMIESQWKSNAHLMMESIRI